MSEIHKTILIKENNWSDLYKIEYREYEWDKEQKIVFHERLTDRLHKDIINKMIRTSIYTVEGNTFDLNKDISISLMMMGDLNEEEEKQRQINEEKERRRDELQAKIRQRMNKK